MSEQGDRIEVKIAMMADVMRSDLKRGLVWFVNYAAIDPSAVKATDLDLHGAAMLPDDVETFAHRWLAFSRSVDINHDGVGRPVHVIESFFNSVDVGASAWPINSHVTRFDVSGSAEALDGLRTGQLNCVSLDAYTFNKVQRLPVAEAQKALGIGPIPTDLKGWVAELAQMGFPGIKAVHPIAPGLFLASRESATPIAVHVKSGEVEANPAGGAWQHVAAALMTSPSLTKMSIGDLLATLKDVTLPGGMVPKHGSPVWPIDWAPWDPAQVKAMLAEHGIRPDGGLGTMLPQKLPAFVEGTGSEAVEQHIELTHQVMGNSPQAGGRALASNSSEYLASLESPWAFVAEDGTGLLPHHTFKGGKLMLSKAGLQDALARLDVVPERHREAAKAHIVSHLEEIERRTGSAEAA